MASEGSANAQNGRSIVTSIIRVLLALLLATVTVNQCHQYLTIAYTIRLHAIKEYGYIIHEFDPWFNFRAAQYLHDNGWEAFVQWFDHKVWYPLGRPVGTTIYPGMQVMAVWLTKSWLPIWFSFKKVLGMNIPKNVVAKSTVKVSKHLAGNGSWMMSTVASFMGRAGMKWIEMSLNDVCCLIPAWFGALATLVTGLIALECSTSFGYGSGSRFGTVLDEIPLFGYYLRKLTTPFQDFLTVISGMDATEYPSATSSTMQMSSLLSMTATMFFMSILPAHIMRSVGGGYDNECYAVFAMAFVFYLWTRSLRGDGKGEMARIKLDNVGDFIRQKQDDGFSLSSRTLTAAFWGALTGVAYFNMAAAWGGYIFVVNLVGVHAAALVLLGRYSAKLHAAYSSFYIVGTVLATRVPVIGLTPLKSLEQMGPLLVFVGLQVIEYCERVRTRDNLTRKQTWLLRLRLAGLVGAVGAAVVAALYPTGHFGPISSRVRGLFVKHTKTGNPLVDSVAEHQQAKPDSYDMYLNIVAKMAPFGFGLVAIAFTNDASSFLLVYGLSTYFFSHKMVRLILLTAPIASVLSGMIVGRVASVCIEGVLGWRLDAWECFSSLSAFFDDDPDQSEAVVEAKIVSDKGRKNPKKKKDEGLDTDTNSKSKAPQNAQAKSSVKNVLSLLTRAAWAYFGYYLFTQAQPKIKSYQEHCEKMAVGMSSPTILYKGTLQGGDEIVVDDYREAYWWLRDNTPEDARIMAWWDYGYQITGISNRTTIADGNTWNHEHIALLGRALTSSLKDGHRIARHLADYVLLWTGGGGDDLAKSPHLARIANSVYRDMCPGDPTCSRFSMPGGQPSPMMKKSLLYRLHSNGLVPGVEADRNRFKEVYKSKYGKVRIYRILSVSKESKKWVMSDRKQACDAHGSWFCPGKYPPGLQKVLKEKKDFKQLEDFNAKTEADDEYQRQYFDHLNDPEKARRRAKVKEQKGRAARGQAALPPEMEDKLDLDGAKKSAPPTKQEILALNQKWEDNKVTSTLFSTISMNDMEQMASILETYPHAGHYRSKDGRGPMWWAYEHGRKNMIKLLKSQGISDRLKDKDGLAPPELADDHDEF